MNQHDGICALLDFVEIGLSRKLMFSIFIYLALVTTGNTELVFCQMYGNFYPHVFSNKMLQKLKRILSINQALFFKNNILYTKLV